MKYTYKLNKTVRTENSTARWLAIAAEESSEITAPTSAVVQEVVTTAFNGVDSWSSMEELAEAVYATGARLYLVGGAVRDKLIGAAPADYDFVCVGDSGTNETIKRWCIKHLDAHMGSGYPVMRVNQVREEEDEDGNVIQWTETFEISFSTDLMSDLSRRDLTINAMAFDFIEGELIDPFNGMKDLKLHIIRAIAAENFQTGAEVFRTAAAVLKMRKKTGHYNWYLSKETRNIMAHAPYGCTAGKLYSIMRSQDLDAMNTLLKVANLKVTKSVNETGHVTFSAAEI